MGKRTILHIEDSGVEREIVRQLLEAEGFEVLGTGEPGEGIELARSKAPDLILVDLHLPDMDGYKTAQHLREIPQLKLVPMIALSATISEEERKRCLTLFDAFLEKPIDIEGFPRKVEELISMGRSYHEHYLPEPEKREREAVEFSPETREVLESLEKVRAAMSHDLRTPLTVIISYANTVAREKVGPLTERQKEMLETVVDHGFQMDTLISELARIAKETLDRFGYPPENKEKQ